MAATLKTQDDVFKLPLPKGEAVYFDEGKPKDRVAGLALRIREGGSRKFCFFYRWGGKLQKLTIGDATAWTLDKARAEARTKRTALDKGENPVEAQRASKAAQHIKPTTFAAIMDDYLAARASDMRPRSLEECTRHLKNHCKPLHGLDFASIGKGTIAERLNTIEKDSGPVARNRVRSTLSAMFTWAIQEDRCEANPVEGTRKSEETSRERVLSDDELVAIWKACPDAGYGRIVRLLMLTGQRREEIGGLRRDEIMHADDSSKALIALPGERTKNHRPHEVPLSAMALEVLKAQPERDGSDYVFGEGEGGYSGWSRSKDALDTAAKLKEDWTLHDLRRTAATRMADPVADGGLGVQPHVIEAVLNHVSGSKSGVAGIYNRSTYAAEKRAALDLWAGHIKMIVAKAEGANVTRLKRA